MIVELKDSHPGKWQEGVRVKLFRAVCKSFSPKPWFITGFRPLEEADETRGMFSPREEPVQMIKRRSGTWEFTMSNCSVLERAEINKLFKEGELHIERGSWKLDIFPL